MKIIKKSVTLNDGREISIETGKLAKQADGSVVVRMGDTMLLATVVSAQDAQPGVDFMPLQVSYKEEFSSLGKFPGGFLKREGRPTDSEVLVCRLVDRALRPLFPANYHADTFVTISLISAEKGVMPDALAGLAASAALAVSDVPIEDFISECRVCRIDGEFVTNPTMEQMAKADIELMVGATYDNILMVEGEFKEISEQEMLETIKIAHEEIKKQCLVQKELAEELNIVKREYNHETNNPELEAKIKELTYDSVLEAAKKSLPKHERFAAFEEIKAKAIEELGLTKEDNAADLELVGKYYHDVEKEAMRNMILDDKQRLDGRKTDEIRQIWSEINYLPGAHGSAIFTRGETQSLTTVTLGNKMDEKMIDSVLYQGKERFVLHYNFPPFSTGDARPARGVSRREIGHGNLAYRALKHMIPAESECPYTIRIVSNILESNGSSSMATVCAGTLALMDAGVKIAKPVTGIAMGLISDVKTNRFTVLSDILGDEDHLGDMDFKVTGTRDGITATQMDIKVDGLPYEVLEQALMQAREGRLHILDKLEETITTPNEDYKPQVPRIEQITIDKDMIGAVIGPGGKVIQEIQKDTETNITLEEVDNKGVVSIFSDNKDNLEAAMARIKAIVAKPEIGEIYDGKVKSITSFGAFVEFMPGKEALLHISEIEWRRLEKVEEVLKEGDKFKVKIIGFDKRTGKIKLSRKVLLDRPKREEKKPEEQKAE